MARTFTTDPALRQYELMMISIPNFEKRHESIYRFKDYHADKKQAGKCIYCADYRKKQGCRLPYCPVMTERYEMGSIDYKGILNHCFRDEPHKRMKMRTESLPQSFNGDMFSDEKHRIRFYAAIKKAMHTYAHIPNRYTATLYLLTADEQLWKNTSDAVSAKTVYFEGMKVGQLTTDSYAYYQAAKEIYIGGQRITPSEMTNPTIISDTAFKVIVHSRLANAFGIEILNQKEQEDKPCDLQ